ncbi:hypothetical protein [Psychrobacillus sp. FSL K6-1464]|uniref:hypothetical protein n=1 Tax=Psychrobacillus sp. FSL K6-1464 TaxID=2921545 RepID=UPI0030FBC21D
MSNNYSFENLHGADQDIKLKVSVEEIKELLAADPLYHIIKNTSLEDDLFGSTLIEDGFATIEDKIFYTTSQVCKVFDKNESSLRYYVKPLQDYIFKDNDVASAVAYRFDLLAVFKLWMILLLKDKYGVRGLKRQLGLEAIPVKDEQGSSSKSGLQTNNQNEIFDKILKGFFNSDSINMVLDEEAGYYYPEVKPEYIEEQIRNHVGVIEDAYKEKLETAEQLLLENKKPDTSVEDEKAKKEQELQIKENAVNEAMSRIHEIEIEAIESWNALDESEKTTKVGLFGKRVEDAVKRSNYILKFRSERLKSIEQSPAEI